VDTISLRLGACLPQAGLFALPAAVGLCEKKKIRCGRVVGQKASFKS
jgi:hypothetical protein